jgi:hypothetical protein
MTRGQAAGAAGWAGVARRPGTARIASVLAVAACLLIVGVQAWTVAQRNRYERSAAETGAEVVLQVRAPGNQALLDAVQKVDPTGNYAMAAVQVTSSGQEPELLAVDSTRADDVIAWGDPNARPSRSLRTTLHPALPAPIRLEPGRISVTAELRQVDTPSPLHLSVRLADRAGSERLDLGAMRLGRHTYSADLPAGCVAADCSLAALSVNHPATDIENASAVVVIHSVDLTPAGGGAAEPVVESFSAPEAWRAGAPSVGGPQVVLEPGEALRARITAPGGPDAEIVHGDAPEPLPALVGPEAGGEPPEAGGLPVGTTTGLGGAPTRYLTAHTAPYIPRAGESAVLVDLGLAMRVANEDTVGDREIWLSRDDPTAERALRRELKHDRISVMRREARGDLERVYAGDGAVLALRLLLVCGAAAVVVAVGALLVAAYVGRRQRAYEVAALRVVGIRRRTVRSLLLRENVGTVVVALVSGTLAALVATWVVLPALPQFDEPSTFVEVRYAPDAASAWTAIGGLGLLLVAVGLVVAVLQLRSGRADRLREGVR